MNEIKIKAGEQLKVMTMQEYEEMMIIINKYNNMVEKRRAGLKKYYDSLSEEEKSERGRKAQRGRK